MLGSGANQISFKVGTTGTVNYTWETIPAGTTGSGTFSGSIATITGLPTNAMIRLKIDSTNFNHLSFNNLINIYDCLRLIDVENWGTIHWSDMDSAFYGCKHLNVSANDIPDLSGVSTMKCMFYYCFVLTGPNNINVWNTSTVTDMSNLFRNDSVFNQPIGNWNTSNVTNMEAMLFSAISFNQPVNNWNTSNVTNMKQLFYRDTLFNQPVNFWNTSNVTDMEQLFTFAYNFNQPIGNWNTSHVTNMGGLFGGAKYFNQPIGNWDVSNVTEMGGMFQQASSFNQPLSNWNTSQVKGMSGMFDRAILFNKPINNWNTSNVTNIGGMFFGATSFNQPIDNWSTDSVLYMNFMFYKASSFNQSLSNWHLNINLVTMENMLDSSGIDCSNYSSTINGWANNSNLPSNVTLGASIMHYGSNAMPDRNYLINTKNWIINGDILNSTTCYPLAVSTIIPNISDFSIYPNPASTILVVSCQSLDDMNATIEIYNTLGQIVYKNDWQIKQGNNSFPLNTQNFSKGIYSVVININHQRTIKELLVN